VSDSNDENFVGANFEDHRVGESLHTSPPELTTRSLGFISGKSLWMVAYGTHGIGHALIELRA